jgi:hypothetical protein
MIVIVIDLTKEELNALDSMHFNSESLSNEIEENGSQ